MKQLLVLLSYYRWGNQDSNVWPMVSQSTGSGPQIRPQVCVTPAPPCFPARVRVKPSFGWPAVWFVELKSQESRSYRSIPGLLGKLWESRWQPPSWGEPSTTSSLSKQTTSLFWPPRMATSPSPIYTHSDSLRIQQEGNPSPSRNNLSCWTHHPECLLII